MPPPLTNSEVGHLAYGVHAGLPAPAQLLGGEPLHGLDDAALEAWPGLVGDAGDLALVAHDTDQAEPLAGHHLTRQRLQVGGVVERGTTRPQVDPAVEQPQGGVEVEADPQRGPGGADDALDQVEVVGRVDHEGDPVGGPFVGGQDLQRPVVGGGVADEDVLDLLGEPQRLAEREGEHAGVPRAAQRPAG